MPLKLQCEGEKTKYVDPVLCLSQLGSDPVLSARLFRLQDGSKTTGGVRPDYSGTPRRSGTLIVSGSSENKRRLSLQKLRDG